MSNYQKNTGPYGKAIIAPHLRKIERKAPEEKEEKKEHKITLSDGRVFISHEIRLLPNGCMRFFYKNEEKENKSIMAGSAAIVLIEEL